MATFYELVSKRRTDMHPDKYILKHRIAPGRRRYKRVETRQGSRSIGGVKNLRILHESGT